MKLIGALVCSAFAIYAQQTCPVAISKITVNGFGASVGNVLWSAAANTPPTPGNFYMISYANTSSKDVMTVRFGKSQYQVNSMLEVTHGQDDFITTEMRKLKPGKAHSIGIVTGDQKLDFAWAEKVLFADGTYWNDDGTHSCKYQIDVKTSKSSKPKK